MATNLTPKAVVLVVEDEPLVRMMAADFVETERQKSYRRLHLLLRLLRPPIRPGLS
jgi:hypothetical protein